MDETNPPPELPLAQRRHEALKERNRQLIPALLYALPALVFAALAMWSNWNTTILAVMLGMLSGERFIKVMKAQAKVNDLIEERHRQIGTLDIPRPWTRGGQRFAQLVPAPILEPGETFLWRGRPGAFAYAMPRMTLAGYGIALIALMLWLGSVNPALSGSSFESFVLAMAWILIAMPVLAFVRAKWLTQFTLSDGRLIWSRLWLGKRHYEMDLKDVTFLNVVRILPDGSGTVRIHADAAERPFLELGPTVSGQTVWLLDGIADVEDVMEKIKSVSPQILDHASRQTQTGRGAAEETGGEKVSMSARDILQEKKRQAKRQTVLSSRNHVADGASPVKRLRR